MTDLIGISAVVIGALSMSVHFGTWLTEQPMRRTTSGAVFTEVQQGRDAVAARVMPVLGNAAIVLVVAVAVTVRSETLPLVLAVGALALFVSDMAVTLTKNLPINKQVQSWTVTAPPADWSTVRDLWERYHSVRTGLVVAGFALLTAAVVLNGS
jgi:hypothetical protein